MTDSDPYPSPSAGQEPSSKTDGLPTYGPYPAAEQIPWRGPAEPGSGPSGPPWLASGPPPSRALAGWALVLAVIPCLLGWLVSVPLAITALVKSRDGRDHGKGMAIAALVIVPCWTVLGVIAVVATFDLSDYDQQANRGSDGGIETSEEIHFTQLRIGDCFEVPDLKGSIFTVDAVPCSRAHQAEVYARFEMASGKFPGTKRVQVDAQGACARRFKPFVGSDPMKTQLDVVTLYPLEQSWEQNRYVICSVIHKDLSKSTGTLRNSHK